MLPITQYVSPTECLFLIQNAKEEDMGPGSIDITSQTFIEPTRMAKAIFRSRKEGKLCGGALLQWVARIYDTQLEVTEHMADGDTLTPGCEIASVTGPLRSILSFERVALNFMTHLSGIAEKEGAQVAEVGVAALEALRPRVDALLAQGLQLANADVSQLFGHDDSSVSPAGLPEGGRGF